MPEYLAPGVYIEEISVGPKPIEGVSTTTAAFVGIAEKGPLNEPTLITDIGRFARTFGGYIKDSYLFYCVDGFFRNGGKRCYIVRVAGATASAAFDDFQDRKNSNVLRISALSEGAWGRNISINIQESPQSTTSMYSSGLMAAVRKTDRVFKPKSTKGLNISDLVKLSDGVNRTALLKVQAIDSDGTVIFIGSLTSDFPKETSRVTSALTASTQQNALSLLSTSGFDAKDLVAFRPAGQDPIYVILDGVKSSEKQVTWTGQFKKADGSVAGINEVRGATLFDVKRLSQSFTLNAILASGSNSIPQTSLIEITDGALKRIRKGDTLTFVTGKTTESVEVTSAGAGANFIVSPTLKSTYTPRDTVNALTAPQSELFSLKFGGQGNQPLPSSKDIETGIMGFEVNDVLVFQGGIASAEFRSVTAVDGTTITLDKPPKQGVQRTSVVAQLKDKAKGVVVKDPAGFQTGDLVLIQSGGTKKVLRIREVKGNRLVFSAEPEWSGDVVNATFVAQEWSVTKVNTLRFRIKANYEKGQVRVNESFDKLSLDPSSTRYVARNGIINDASNLIRIVDLRGISPSAPTKFEELPRSTGATKKLSTGNDGLLGIAASDYIGKISADDERTGLTALEEVDEVSMVCIPDLMTTFGGGRDTTSPDDVELVQLAMIDHCERLKDRFAVLDPIKGQSVQKVQAWREDNLDSTYAALYYPWIAIHDPIQAEDGNVRLVPPSGHIAGVYARSDIERGVHKAPANEVVRGVLRLERGITVGEQEVLNPDGVNCIRALRGRGIRVWGARTVSSDPEWKYVNVRRLFLYLEESIEEATQWVVFEPNDLPTWQRLKASVTEFLERVWRSGALAGASSEEAFFVKCDHTTMTDDDIKNGRLICLIGIAPVRPAEFVVFRIHQWQGGSEVNE